MLTFETILYCYTINQNLKRIFKLDVFETIFAFFVALTKCVKLFYKIFLPSHDYVFLQP